MDVSTAARAKRSPLSLLSPPHAQIPPTPVAEAEGAEMGSLVIWHHLWLTQVAVILEDMRSRNRRAPGINGRIWCCPENSEHLSPLLTVH